MITQVQMLKSSKLTRKKRDSYVTDPMKIFWEESMKGIVLESFPSGYRA
jgi:hypothetical protein